MLFGGDREEEREHHPILGSLVCVCLCVPCLMDMLHDAYEGCTAYLCDVVL